MIPAQKLFITIINTEVNNMPLNEEFAQRGTLKLNYNGSDDRHQYMMPSELSFSMEVSDASDLFFEHLFTGNESNYEVVLTNENDLVIWRGHILPEQYEEPYEHALLYVNFTATDGLARLKGKTLPDHMYQNRYSVIRFFYECLLLTNLQQEIYFAPAFKNDSPDIGSNWNKILIDGATYSDSDDNNDDNNDDCYKIMESLLETLGCSLFTYLGKWYITGHNRYEIQDSGTSIIQYYKYSATGAPAGFLDMIIEPELMNLEAIPQISLKPPYQKVEVTWNIDERSSILPDDIIVQPYENNFDWQNPPQVLHWVASAAGLGIRREVLTDPKLATSGAFLSAGGVTYTNDELERRRNMVSATLFASLNNFSLALTDNTGYYMELERPIYLKSDPDSIDIEMTIVGKFAYIDNSGPFPELNEDDYNNNHLNYEILYNGQTLISNLPSFINRDAYLLDISFEGESLSSSASPKRIVGRLSLKDMVLPTTGGFLQLRIYAMGGAANNIKGQTVGCRILSINYTADQEHIYEMTRPIDWTTSIELDITHGGNVNDISDSHFTLENGDPNESNYTEQDVLGVFPFALGLVPPFTVYNYIEVTAAGYTALQNALTTGVLIYGLPTNQSVYKLINTDYSGLFGFQMLKENAGRFFAFLEYVDGSPFLYYEIFGTLIKDALFIYNSSAAVPDIDRAFREKWSRINSTVTDENKRYGEVRAQMVHDTQPSELVSFDTSVFGLLDPWSVKQFKIKGVKNFIITDISLGLDQGMTRLTAVQLKLDPDVETEYNLIVEE
jgi:hypothetical protein